MSETLINIVSSQGIWTLLSFILIYYIIQTQEKRDEKQSKREEKYQDIIKELTHKFELINDTLKEIKEAIKK